MGKPYGPPPPTKVSPSNRMAIRTDPISGGCAAVRAVSAPLLGSLQVGSVSHRELSERVQNEGIRIGVD